MSGISLFVCCHQPVPVPDHPLLTPVQVGAALSDRSFEGFTRDDSGEHISEKNRSYCELTAQYWAWKNAQADWYGFFHYRRFLYPDPNARRPYRPEGDPTRSALDRLGYDGFAELIRQYDLIAPMGEDMHITVREHYASAPHHRKNDLELVEQILQETCPDYVPAMEAYLSGTVCYFGNIYIMHRRVFHDYCAWLFPILEQFDRRADFDGRTPQELRVNGYLAERLFGIWLTHRRNGLKVLELPRVHWVTDPSALRKQRIMTRILPPGTHRRAFIKRLRSLL